ncbi:MAG: Tm-1-like ATP-binding domain-containing protein [Eubacterium sp.]|nr:Tm-1-like ATP-binding domain-containing protein [Eubacterium sp.]
MNDIVIAVVGTFDTKSEEYQYLIDRLSSIRFSSMNVKVLTIDVSTRDTALLHADYGIQDICSLADADIETLTHADRADAIAVIMRGASSLILELFRRGSIHGMISIGGSGGTTIATHIMRQLPVGFPKVMITTKACSSNMPDFIGSKDLIVINSIVDVSGTNSIISKVYDEGAGAVAGAAMIYASRKRNADRNETPSRPKIAVSMYGITTPCVTHAVKYLESKGYEPIVFHANGAGGKAMKTLISEGMFAGVLDVTTAEAAAEALGSDSASAGPDRLDAAVIAGLPQVLSVGGVDVIGIRVEELDSKFAGHTPYCHNDKPDMIRTTPRDGIRIGEFMCKSLNNSYAPCAVFLPLRSVSSLDEEGGLTHDDEARRLLYETINRCASSAVHVKEMDCDINDPAFAEAMAACLVQYLQSGKEV